MAASDKSFFRHKHLWIYHKYWDFDGDGSLSWEDFNMMAEKYAVYQRKGKWDDEVVANWRKVARKWWDSLYARADQNQDSRIDIDEWMEFFEDFSKSKHTLKDIPEFLSGFLQLFFVSLDYNKDGLFCVEDYKSYLGNYHMDLTNAKEHFQTLLTDEDKAMEGGKLTQDRFNELVLDFLCSHDPASKGRYICGPYDSMTLEDLESKCKHLSSKN